MAFKGAHHHSVNTGVADKPMSVVSQALLSEDAKCLSLVQFLQLLCNTQDLKVC